MANRSVSLLRLFAFLDAHGTDQVTAVVSATLANDQGMTIRAGGPGTHAGPLGGPFLTFEVLVDHEPPRFWRQYGRGEDSIYTHVPRLLLAHHIERSGGIDVIDYETHDLMTLGKLEISLEVPAGRKQLLLDLMSGVRGVRIIGYAYSDVTE